jgi:isocitrate dehydrogenase (NAD+)
MAYEVTLILGDGVGPELAEAAKMCIEATGVSIKWDEQEAGVDVMAKLGTPLPDSVIESCRRTKVALKAPVTTPVGTGFRSVNVHLRHALDLYACVRPCKLFKGVRSYFSNAAVDLVIVRENTESLYFGCEFEQGKPETAELIADIKRLNGKTVRPDSGITIKAISITGTRRIVKYALEYARKHGRKKVTAVHKANILKYSDGLFLQVARDVAKEYADIEFEDRIVDNMCMQLVQKPELYDVMVLPNLYGDIVSDLCAGLVGGLGVVPGANYGDKGAIFEAVHGTAPDIAGKGLANPIAAILSGAMLLEYLGHPQAARRIRDATGEVLQSGDTLTRDLGGSATTRQMTDAIIAAMHSHASSAANRA